MVEKPQKKSMTQIIYGFSAFITQNSFLFTDMEFVEMWNNGSEFN